MALDQLYQKLILDHNRCPRHRGRLKVVTHSARGQDALCGDDILIELRVVKGLIDQAAFSGEACAITMASASMLMEWLPGHTADELLAARQRFTDLLDRPTKPDDDSLGDLNALRSVSNFPARKRNALLPWETAVRALKSEVP